MSITFHCKYCGKKIKAPDGVGGKWSKCPACHSKLYIPGLNAEGEQLKLAPLDKTEEERQKKLMDETHKLQQDILSQTDDNGQ